MSTTTKRESARDLVSAAMPAPKADWALTSTHTCTRIKRKEYGCGVRAFVHKTFHLKTGRALPEPRRRGLLRSRSACEHVAL